MPILGDVNQTNWATPPQDQRTAPAWAYMDNVPKPDDPNTWPPGVRFSPAKNQWQVWVPDETPFEEAEYLGRESPDPSTREPDNGPGSWNEASYSNPNGVNPWKVIGILAAAGTGGQLLANMLIPGLAAGGTAAGGSAAAPVLADAAIVGAGAPGAAATGAGISTAAATGTAAGTTAAGTTLPVITTAMDVLATAPIAATLPTSAAITGASLAAAAPTLVSVTGGPGFPTATDTAGGMSSPIPSGEAASLPSAAGPATGAQVEAAKGGGYISKALSALTGGDMPWQAKLAIGAGQAITSYLTGRSAVKAQQEATDKALALQKQAYEDRKANLAPYLRVGTQAMTNLGALTGHAPPQPAPMLQPGQPAPNTPGAIIPRVADGIRSAAPFGASRPPVGPAPVAPTGGGMAPRGGVTMRSPDGRTVMVPHDRVAEAQKQGGQVVS